MISITKRTAFGCPFCFLFAGKMRFELNILCGKFLKDGGKLWALQIRIKKRSWLL